MQQWTKTQFLGWRENWLNIWLSYSTLVRLGMIKIIFAEYTWLYLLTHWGRVTHICVIKLTIIGSVNDLAPERRLAIIWTNGGILSIGPLGTNFNEILIKIHTFSPKKMPLKTSSAKRRPFCLGLNVSNMSCHLKYYYIVTLIIYDDQAYIAKKIASALWPSTTTMLTQRWYMNHNEQYIHHGTSCSRQVGRSESGWNSWSHIKLIHCSVVTPYGEMDLGQYCFVAWGPFY